MARSHSVEWWIPLTASPQVQATSRQSAGVGGSRSVTGRSEDSGMTAPYDART